MSGHVIVQRQPGTAQVANLRLALIKKSQFEKNVHSFLVRMLIARHSQRVAEEAAQLRRPQESVGRQSDVRVMPSEKGSPKGGV